MQWQLQAGTVAYDDVRTDNGRLRTPLPARALIADFARWQLSEAMVCAGAVPVLISAGDRDAMAPVAEITKLFSALGPKLGAVAILPGTPHALQHLPLECFAHLVRCFLVLAAGKGRHK